MPERWRRELQRLRRVEPGAELWSRVQDGPVGTPSPVPGRQRLVAGGVAFVVFISAGLFAWNAFRATGSAVIGDASFVSPGPDDLVVTLRAPTEPSTENELHLPTAAFRLGGEETTVPTQGMTGWPDIPINGFDQPLYYLGFSVPAGTRLVIEGDATSANARVRDGVAITSPTQELDLSEGATTLPSFPGEYVMELTGTWAEGTATFTTQFKVVPADAVAVLAFDERDLQAPGASLIVADETFPAVLGTHSWTFDGGSGSADAVMPTFTDAEFIQVARGTPLFLRDPPSHLAISANQSDVPDGGPTYDLTGPGASLDMPAGRFLVIVDAEWADAQAEFWLPIEIVDRQVPADAVVTRDAHAPVSSAVSEGCPAVAGDLTTSATSAVSGDRLTLAGAIYHQREDGSFFVSPTEDYQAWWGLTLDGYTDAGTVPSEIANGDQVPTPRSGPRMLGDHRPNGACGFDISLVVPDVAPGSYDLTVISADAEGYAAYGTLTIEVLPST
jgi:hypothetical protein